jgi:hypothetical protein
VAKAMHVIPHFLQLVWGRSLYISMGVSFFSAIRSRHTRHLIFEGSLPFICSVATNGFDVEIALLIKLEDSKVRTVIA